MAERESEVRSRALTRQAIMEKLELRARARAAARAGRYASPLDQDAAEKARGVLPPPLDIIDETHARAACKPMGELEYVVQSADARGRVRALYVIVPDLALKAHYERLGLTVEAGCRVLLDAGSLLPIAVLRVSDCIALPPTRSASAGFNPYFDIPAA
jgi:hypothetical protein